MGTCLHVLSSRDLNGHLVRLVSVDEMTEERRFVVAICGADGAIHDSPLLKKLCACNLEPALRV